LWVTGEKTGKKGTKRGKPKKKGGPPGSLQWERKPGSEGVTR